MRHNPYVPPPVSRGGSASAKSNFTARLTSTVFLVLGCLIVVLLAFDVAKFGQVVYVPYDPDSYWRFNAILWKAVTIIITIVFSLLLLAKKR